MSFARKAVQWDQEDVKSASAVLSHFAWNIDRALMSVDYGLQTGIWNSPERVLLPLLDFDHEAMKSLLIFVNEFRCLIEGAEQPTEGTNNVDAVKKAL